MTLTPLSCIALCTDALPLPVQDALAQAKTAAGQLTSQLSDLAAANPGAAKAAALPLVGAPVLLWLAGRFGGYKGPLPPSETYDILQVIGGVVHRYTRCIYRGCTIAVVTPFDNDGDSTVVVLCSFFRRSAFCSGDCADCKHQAPHLLLMRCRKRRRYWWIFAPTQSARRRGCPTCSGMRWARAPLCRWTPSTLRPPASEADLGRIRDLLHIGGWNQLF